MTNKKLLKMAIDIVSFPINSMVIFHSYVSLPEGIPPKLLFHGEMMMKKGSFMYF